MLMRHSSRLGRCDKAQQLVSLAMDESTFRVGEDNSELRVDVRYNVGVSFLYHKK